MKRIKRHCLPRIPGTIREKGYIAMEAEIKETLRFIAEQHNCSISFVENTILADALKIKVPMRYYELSRITRKVKKTA